jgi:hypothetical protein
MTPMTTRVLRKDFLKGGRPDSDLQGLYHRGSPTPSLPSDLLNMSLCFMSAARLTG